jgi:hypothetical protein
MNETPTKTEFADALLSQEQPIPEAQYAQYRARLAVRLARATRREKLARGITLTTCVIAVAGLVLGLLIDRVRVPWPWKDAFFVVVTLAAGCAPLFLLLYFLRHRTALGHARDESNTAVLIELERQVEQLRRQDSSSH